MDGDPQSFAKAEGCIRVVSVCKGWLNALEMCGLICLLTLTCIRMFDIDLNESID